MCLDKMLLCKDETRRQQHLHPVSSLLVPTPKSGLAKGLFPGDLDAAAKCLVPLEGMFQARYPAEFKTCEREEVRGAYVEVLHAISLPAGLCAPAARCLPGCSGLRTQTENLLQSPRPLVTPKSCLPLDIPGRCIFTPYWLHQVFEPPCLLTKSLQRNRSVLGLRSPPQSPEQGFHSPSAARLRGGNSMCWMHAASSLCGSCLSGQNLDWTFL